MEDLRGWLRVAGPTLAVLLAVVGTGYVLGPDSTLDVSETIVIGGDASITLAWLAHCDGLDGPVVKAAQAALAHRNVNLALIWVRAEDEPEIRAAFEQTLAVRALDRVAESLADRHFFETLVRLHRAGEGAGYSGLQPAGRDLGPVVPAADEAVETGDAADLERLLSGELVEGLRDRFGEVTERRSFDPDDVARGREFVHAYVEFIHFAERIHEDVTHAAEGHYVGASRDEH